MYVRSYGRPRDRIYTPTSSGTEEDDFAPVQQHLKDLADINQMMVRYARTGEFDHINLNAPGYGDFSSSMDLQDSLNAINAANASFDALPAAIRERMNNDPIELLRFVEDDSNREEAMSLGLLEPTSEPLPSQPAPIQAEVPPAVAGTEANPPQPAIDE